MLVMALLSSTATLDDLIKDLIENVNDIFILI